MGRLGIAAAILWLMAPNAHAAPAYDGDKLVFPADYRTWTYVTTGFGMAYRPMNMGAAFDNVFVNPEAYKAFLETGSWPEGTELVLEVRVPEQKGALLKAGHFQGAVADTEIHVKDSKRFKGGWAFFAFPDQSKPAEMIPTTEDCYACHQSHAAVDTTFVQFYPTLLPVAVQKKTLSPSYLAEEAKH
jgi:hypothetical protein